MSLPLAPLPIVERWDCHQCGFCCKGSIVPLNEHDVARLKEQGWPEHPDFRGVKTIVPLPGRKDKLQLGKRPDGSCVFLMEDGLCRIHKDLGFAAKPLICRMFPLQLVPREKDAVITLRRACPSAAADKGRTVEAWLPDVRAYAEEGKLLEQGAAAPPVKPGEPPDWKRARVVLEALKRLSCDERYPPIRRIVHGLEYCRLLEAAKTAEMNAGKLAELSQVLEEHVPEEASPYFAEREQPRFEVRTIFRQIALEVARLHPRVRPAPSWKLRFQLPLWAWTMVRGRGKLPRIHEIFADTTFDELEQPLGSLATSATKYKLDPLIYAAFGRYVETSAASYQFAMADKPGWSIVESYRELAMLYPLGCWLLHWLTAGRAPTPEDAYEVICTLDRSQGFAPLYGSRQRGRLRTLTKLGQWPQLVAWYGR